MEVTKTIEMELYEIEPDTAQLFGFVDGENLWLEGEVIAFDEEEIIERREVDGKVFVLLNDTSQWFRVGKNEGTIYTKERGGHAGYSTFKMRCEFEADVKKALRELWMAGISLLDYKVTYIRFHGHLVPDVECTFTTENPTNITDVRKALGKVVDGHVMVESVEAEQYYDGVRRREKPLTPGYRAVKK